MILAPGGWGWPTGWPLTATIDMLPPKEAFDGLSRNKRGAAIVEAVLEFPALSVSPADLIKRYGLSNATAYRVVQAVRERRAA
jgi:hypothetical protein